jgi:ubiquinone biosynthesis monooxygenase Coq7
VERDHAQDHYRPDTVRRLSFVDRLLAIASRGLADATTAPTAIRPNPAGPERGAGSEDAMNEGLREHAAGLMRVNHVGEVCAQALYEGHALTVRDPRLAAYFLAAADEERDHLAWTRLRLNELQSRPSLLNPVWYLGSLSLGSLAGLAGGRWALGFMAETERQVEAHLASHLDRLPVEDIRSRAIVEQMKADEGRHADEAYARGGARMPPPIPGLMRLMSKVMTTVAYRL